MNILSMQSHVVYGYVGNSAAVFPLQRLGHTVWPVHTTMLSNHLGYADAAGSVVLAGELTRVIDALDRRGVLGRCDGVLSGYLGSAAVGDVVLDTVARVRGHCETAIYCCDPVMGDRDATYVEDDVVEFMRDRAAPAADILTPNLYELSLLGQMAPGSLDHSSLDEILKAARQLIRGDNCTTLVLVTSCDHAALPAAQTAMVAVTADSAWHIATPRIHFDAAPHGAGDCSAAFFSAAIVSGGTVATALSHTASAVHSILERTAQSNSVELALVAAQNEIVAPPRTFTAESIT